MAGECITSCAEAATSRTGMRPPPTRPAAARRGALGGIFDRLAAAARRRHSAAATVRLLRSLDDHILRDVGVPPDRIREFVTDVADRHHRR